MRPHVAWKDDAGVVHALVDDEEAEREPPYPLLSMCDAGMHTHAHSEEIRAAGITHVVTCVRCLDGLHFARKPVGWPHSNDAPCCSLFPRAT